MSLVVIGIVGAIGAIGGWLVWLVNSANSAEFAIQQREVSYKEVARIVEKRSTPANKAEAEKHLADARAHLDTAKGLVTAMRVKRAEVLQELLQVDEALRSARVLVMPDQDDDDDDNWLTEQ